MTDDMTLLREYARTQSEAAFAELVTRYVNLVHSVAMRQVRDPHLAEEITQAVFVILARKAGGLGPQVILAGWLCRTARYASANALTTQRRRQQREQEAHMQSVLDSGGVPSSPMDEETWRQIAPLLDQAMERLGKPDHDALVLRFFEGKNFKEVGTALGASEDTARMRVNRALEKLRQFFTKRGVSSTTVIIAGVISAHSVQAAPAALAKSVTVIAAAKGAAASGSTLTLINGALKIMAWTKAKMAVAAGAALILTAGTGMVVVKQVHAAKAVRAALHGYPQTLAELDAWYVEPPAGQNAATFHLEGIKARQLNGADQNASLPILGKLPPPSPGTPLPPAVKSALTAFVGANREAMQRFAQGAQCEQSRYPIDLTQGSETLLPHLAGIKSATQISGMAAILDAENQEGKQAAEDVLLALGLAGSLKAEPETISQLVRVASVALAVAGLEQVVNRTTVPAASLSELSKAFQMMENYDARGEGFERAMVGEQVNHRALLKDQGQLVHALTTPGIMDLPDEQRRRLVQYVDQPGSLKAEQDYLETTFQQVVAARQAAFPERLKAGDVIQQRVAKATARGLLINGLLDATASTVAREARGLALLRLALVAVALEEFRATHGNRYPGALSELTPGYLPAPLADPFDGQPLRYRQQGAGYLLYSIGPDLKDDGGKRSTGNAGDVVFAVVTPPTT